MANINAPKSRILFKTDTTTNWNNLDFSTQKGELYFFQDFSTTGEALRPRVKIGTGEKLNVLPFLQNDHITLEQIQDLLNQGSALDRSALGSFKLY